MVGSRRAPADGVGAHRALAAPGHVRARGADDARRRRPGARPRGRAGRRRRACCCCTGWRGAPTRCTRRGWRCWWRARDGACTVLNFRSCARDARDIERRLPNRRPRLYHSGETGDLDFVVRTLVGARARDADLRARLLAGRRGAAQVAGRGRPRQRHPRGRDNLRSLRSRGGVALPGTAAWAGSTPSTSSAAQVEGPGPAGPLSARDGARRSRSRPAARGQFREFDDCLTAPLHGFAGADDYYRRASSLPFLAQVAVPTLCLSSEDDPFFPANGDRARDAAAATCDSRSRRGGHTGFVSGRWPWRPHTGRRNDHRVAPARRRSNGRST